jgi:DNA-binding transcriptional MerR regulator/methanogenic corrinoid protein MtbC1
VHDGGEASGYLRIGELSRRSGVSPELLRAWEDRYALLSPSRTTGGFRLYDQHDERRVRLMRQFLSSGVAAAEAARLTLAERDTAFPMAAPSIHDLWAGEDALARAFDRFDDAGAHAALDRIFSAYGLEIALRDVLMPYLHELGDRWERGAVTIAQEHFATALLRGRLLSLARGWGGGDGPLALLACVPGDLHDLGLICFGLALRSHGWRITFLGPDSPIHSIAETAKTMRPTLIVVAAALPLAHRHEVGLEAIARLAPLAFGGAGANAALAQAIGAKYLPDDPIMAAKRIASVHREI